MKTPKLILLIFVILLLIAGACSPAGTGSEPGVEETSPPAEMEEPESEPAEMGQEAGNPKIELTDASGNSLSFEAKPERIAVAGKAGQLILHSAYLFPEATDQIAAMEQRLQKDISMLPLVDPNVDEKIQLEKGAAAEQIAPAKPDAVLMKTYMAEDLGEPLEQLGIPVVYFDLETPEQFTRDIKVLGVLFDDPERADQILTFYQGKLDEVEAGMEGLQIQDRHPVLLIQYDNKGGEVAFKVPPTDWLQTLMVELAGGEPVWAEASEAGGWTVVNFEQIAAWNPEIIILVNYFGDPGEVVDELNQDPNWQALQAVQGDKLFAFPGDFLSWDQPDPRWILGLEWLAKTIYPERFVSLDMTEEIKNFYSEMYGLDAEKVENEVLPLVTGDIGN
ncbi:MAG: ABC transporter substrate-binding protein [Anaerolineales bacterium]|jgi:iron complex transport system substrate-binding protein